MGWELPGEIRVEWAQSGEGRQGQGSSEHGWSRLGEEGFRGRHTQGRHTGEGTRRKAHLREGSPTGSRTPTGMHTYGKALLVEGSPRWTPVSGQGFHTATPAALWRWGSAGQIPPALHQPRSLWHSQRPCPTWVAPNQLLPGCLLVLSSLLDRTLASRLFPRDSTPAGSTSLTADSRVRKGRGCIKQLNMCRSPGSEDSPTSPKEALSFLNTRSKVQSADSKALASSLCPARPRFMPASLRL